MLGRTKFLRCRSFSRNQMVCLSTWSEACLTKCCTGPPWCWPWEGPSTASSPSTWLHSPKTNELGCPGLVCFLALNPLNFHFSLFVNFLLLNLVFFFFFPRKKSQETVLVCLWNTYGLPDVSTHLTVKSIVSRNSAVSYIWVSDLPGGSGGKLRTCSWRAAPAEAPGTWGCGSEPGVQEPFWIWGVTRGRTAEPRAWYSGEGSKAPWGFSSCSKMLVEPVCSLPLFTTQFVSKDYLPHLGFLVDFHVSLFIYSSLGTEHLFSIALWTGVCFVNAAAPQILFCLLKMLWL